MASWHLNGVVLPGTEPVDLWVRDGVISAEPVAGAETLGSGWWIMPGLVDAHSHIGLGAGGAVDTAVVTAGEQLGAATLVQAAAAGRT